MATSNVVSNWEEIVLTFEDGRPDIPVTVDRQTARKLLDGDEELLKSIQQTAIEAQLQPTSPAGAASAVKCITTEMKITSIDEDKEDTNAMRSSTFSERKDLMANPTVKKTEVWSKISDDLTTLGYNKSASLCEKKWSNLKIRTLKDSMKKTGRGRSCWIFYQQMDEILGKDPATVPIATISSNPEESTKHNLASNKQKTETAKSGRKRPASTLIEDFIEMQKKENEECRAEFREFRKEFLEMQKEKNDILRSLAEALMK